MDEESKPEPELKPICWIGPSKKELCQFPEGVQHDIGVALMRVQFGDTPPNVKRMQGFGPGVVEIIDEDDSGTYRAACTVRFRERVYVLHCFHKKSKKGIKTPRQNLDVIETRLRWAIELHKQWVKQHETE